MSSTAIYVDLETTGTDPEKHEIARLPLNEAFWSA